MFVLTLRLEQRSILRIPRSKSRLPKKELMSPLRCHFHITVNFPYTKKKAYASLKKIAQIRSNITKEATQILVNALVTPHLDNNRLLYDLPHYLLDRLQMIENNAAGVITKTKCLDLC